MPGFSITTLLLPSASETGKEVPDASLLLSLVDAPANVPGWKWASNTAPPDTAQIPSGAKKQGSVAAAQETVTLRAEDSKAFDTAVERACRALGDAEPEITRYDLIAGDGDCGLTLKAGAAGTCSVMGLWGSECGPGLPFAF